MVVTLKPFQRQLAPSRPVSARLSWHTASSSTAFQLSWPSTNSSWDVERCQMIFSVKGRARYRISSPHSHISYTVVVPYEIRRSSFLDVPLFIHAMVYTNFGCEDREWLYVPFCRTYTLTPIYVHRYIERHIVIDTYVAFHCLCSMVHTYVPSQGGCDCVHLWHL